MNKKIVSFFKLETEDEKNEMHPFISSLQLWGDAHIHCHSFDQFKSEIENSAQKRESSLVILNSISHEIQNFLKSSNSRNEVIHVLSSGCLSQTAPEELQEVNHFLSASQGHLATLAFIAALKKISTREIFGIQKYLAFGTPTHEYHLSRSDDRCWFIDKLTDFVMSVEGMIPSGASQFARMSGDVLDEFMMNAIWDANPHRSLVDRSIPVVLGPHEAIKVEWGMDGKVLALGVKDPFGTLQREALRKYHEEFLGRKRQEAIKVNTEGPGAGLGLHMVLRRISGLIINVAPRFHSEVIALYDLTQSPRHLAKGPKTFNFFSG